LNAVTILLCNRHRIRSRQRVTGKRERSVRQFVVGSMTRPDIFGEAIIKIGNSKKELLQRRHGEISVISKKGGVRVRKHAHTHY